MGAKINSNQRTGQAGSLCGEGLEGRGEEGWREEESRDCNRPLSYCQGFGFDQQRGLGGVVILFDVGSFWKEGREFRREQD